LSAVRESERQLVNYEKGMEEEKLVGRGKAAACRRKNK
jgi:hypothetical protein